tara:strand:+ start:217 stop:726 length:510 start_codon:yes stop_codon:yes gene_type:complete
MNYLSKKIFVFFTFMFLIQPSYADQKFKFVNIDLIIKETNIGSQMLDKINKLDQTNIKKLNSFEQELKKIENDIKSKKNILSDLQFEKEVNDFKVKVANYNKEKDLMVKKLNETKKKELQVFFKKINPIVQNYMNMNSIEMLFNSKNIFMGNKNSDLTNQLINEINNKI